MLIQNEITSKSLFLHDFLHFFTILKKHKISPYTIKKCYLCIVFEYM